MPCVSAAPDGLDSWLVVARKFWAALGAATSIQSSSVRVKATKRTLKICRKKDKPKGKQYIRGEILDLEVESQGAADNFLADSLTAGETKIDAGAAKSGKQALSRGISAMKMAKAFNGDLPWD